MMFDSCTPRRLPLPLVLLLLEKESVSICTEEFLCKFAYSGLGSSGYYTNIVIGDVDIKLADVCSYYFFLALSRGTGGLLSNKFCVF